MPRAHFIHEPLARGNLDPLYQSCCHIRAWSAQHASCGKLPSPPQLAKPVPLQIGSTFPPTVTSDELAIRHLMLRIALLDFKRTS
jgi:hypothetical protein